MSSETAKMQSLLYQDDTVQIYNDKICILKYYFPIPASKTIDMLDVQGVYLRDNVDAKVWGTSPGHMDTWFALDNNRHLKKQYLELSIRGSDVKPCFSPTDPMHVMSIIQTNSALMKTEQNLKGEIKQLKGNLQYTTKTETKVKQPTPTITETIKQKFNETVQGVKNVKDSVLQKYEQGKLKGYKDTHAKNIQSTKENINQEWQQTKIKTAQKYKEAGQALKQKGNILQKQAFQS